MWCRRQAAAAIVSVLLAGWLTGDSIQALTTFGKSDAQHPKDNVQTTQSPARPCSRQTECAGISGTSCVRTSWDPTTRCLCGDNQPPVNGQCEPTQNKNLYHLCDNSDQCNDGLVCLLPNITFKEPHLRVYSGLEKRICLCDTENGYQEKDHSCSDADMVKTSLLAILLITSLRKLLVY